MQGDCDRVGGAERGVERAGQFNREGRVAVEGNAAGGFDCDGFRPHLVVCPSERLCRGAEVGGRFGGAVDGGDGHAGNAVAAACAGDPECEGLVLGDGDRRFVGVGKHGRVGCFVGAVPGEGDFSGVPAGALPDRYDRVRSGADRTLEVVGVFVLRQHDGETLVALPGGAQVLDERDRDVGRAGLTVRPEKFALDGFEVLAVFSLVVASGGAGVLEMITELHRAR